MSEDQNRDLDAQFRDLVAGMETDLDAGGVPEDAAASQNPATDDLDTPVDEALHLEGGKLSVALILAPIHEAVVRLKPWTGVWLRVQTQTTQEDELNVLLTGRRAMPAEVDKVASVISRLSKYGAVAIMSWLVEGDGIEPGVSGQITAQRYVNGHSEDDIPAGLLLGAMPQATEDLLLGRTVPEDYPDSIQADGKGGKRGRFMWFRKR